MGFLFLFFLHQLPVLKDVLLLCQYQCYLCVLLYLLKYSVIVSLSTNNLDHMVNYNSKKVQLHKIPCL